MPVSKDKSAESQHFS